jgi:arginyl-tRNA--protein-N-Asp/Glu arginylyltransferase
VPVENPKHHYEIEFHRALFTEELFEVYTRYEMAVHKKERDRD